jgi:hypothetical protein
MEAQKTLNSQSNPKKKSNAGGIITNLTSNYTTEL